MLVIGGRRLVTTAITGPPCGTHNECVKPRSKGKRIDRGMHRKPPNCFVPRSMLAGRHAGLRSSVGIGGRSTDMHPCCHVHRTGERNETYSVSAALFTRVQLEVRAGETPRVMKPCGVCTCDTAPRSHAATEVLPSFRGARAP